MGGVSEKNLSNKGDAPAVLVGMNRMTPNDSYFPQNMVEMRNTLYAE